MLPDITQVEHLGEFRLRLRFDDGTEGELDLKPLLSFRGVFEPLRDPEYFARVRVDADLGTICWPNEADLDPVVLYARVTGTDVPDYGEGSAAA